MSLTADEWFDVLREAGVEITREEFEKEWAKFQEFKRARMERRVIA